MRIASAFVCLVLPFLATFAPDVSAQNITWTGTVNVTVSGMVLTKTGGCDGCLDAGAVSQQTIPSGDGYVDFTIGETNTFFFAGLSHGNDDTGFADIDFAFRFNGAGSADVLENGVYQPGGDTPYAVGDVFRVAVLGSKVQFIRNGFVLLEQAKAPVYPLLLDTSFGTMGATVRNAHLAITTPDASGGFLEKDGSRSYRARFTKAQINAFLPPNGGRGKFKFPAPYNTQALRLTTASDCGGGRQDCLWYVGYSYWRNINSHAGQSFMYIFLGLDKNRGGAGPTLFYYDKRLDRAQSLGPLFPPLSPYSSATGEGWYWSGTNPNALYTFLVGGGQLRRYDVRFHTFDPVPALDVSKCPKPSVCSPDVSTINQPHSSDDDLVHSVTVQDAVWRRIGCLVYRTVPREFQYYPVTPGDAFDECHVDKSGRWLIILESDPSGAGNNRIVDLVTRTTRIINDVEGGLGHLDTGFGYAVGADNYNPAPNATILVDLASGAVQRPVGPVVHFNKRWDIVASNHVTHGNARPGSPNGQFACGSNASRVADMADEIVCYSLNPDRNADGSLDTLIVAQTMTDLDAPGGTIPGGGDYEKTPKGNLDVTGKYFIWTSNMSGDRLDAFIVKVPSQLLTAPAP